MADYFEQAKKTHDEAVEKREAMPQQDAEGAEQAFEIF